MRNPIRAVLSAVAAVLFVLTTATAAHAAGETTIKNNTNNLCLDFAPLAGPYYHEVVQKPCSGAVTQNWVFVPTSAVEYSLVRNASLNSRCLEIRDSSLSDGATLVLMPCSPTTFPQLWKPDGAGRLVSLRSAKCVAAYGPLANAPVFQYTCGGGAMDQWTWTP